MEKEREKPIARLVHDAMMWTPRLQRQHDAETSMLHAANVLDALHKHPSLSRMTFLTSSS